MGELTPGMRVIAYALASCDDHVVMVAALEAYQALTTGEKIHTMRVAVRVRKGECPHPWHRGEGRTSGCPDCGVT